MLNFRVCENKMPSQCHLLHTIRLVSRFSISNLFPKSEILIFSFSQLSSRSIATTCRHSPKYSTLTKRMENSSKIPETSIAESPDKECDLSEKATDQTTPMEEESTKKEHDTKPEFSQLSKRAQKRV